MQFIQEIVKWTNQKGTELFTDNWNSTSATEMRAFFGLLINAGFSKQNLTYDEILWSERLGPLIYRATMSLNRFRQLRRSIRFDDATTRTQRKEKSKLAPIKDLWDDFEKRLGLSQE